MWVRVFAKMAPTENRGPDACCFPMGRIRMNGAKGWIRVVMSLFALAWTGTAAAHAIVGMRVFPGTLTFSDPGITDELDLTGSHATVGAPGSAPVPTSEFSLDYSKTITPRMGVSVGTDYQSLEPGAGPHSQGMDNVTVGASYLLWKSDREETLLTGGLNTTIGGSGSRAIGASYTTYSPNLLFGRGFGDLPGRYRYLRPLAVTGVVSPNITQGANVPDTLTWGLSLQYSVPYLQSFVRDIGLRAPLNKMVPLVEFLMQTCTSGACAGQTVGTINPGVVWIGYSGQVGLEAAIPVNRASGHGIGVLFSVGFYFDDMYPHTLGAPLFGAHPASSTGSG